jgi:hypothetical protein
MHLFLRRLVGLAAVGLVVSLAAPRARAIVFVEGDLSALGIDETNVYSEQSPFRHVFSDDPSDHAPFGFALATPYSLISTEARGGFGWLQIVTAGSASVGPPPDEEQTRVGGTLHDVRAGFRDTITIDAPGLTGQAGSAVLGIDVEGVLSTGADWFVDQSNASAYGDVALSFVAASLVTNLQHAVESNPPGGGTGLNPAEIVEGFLGGTVPFVFGTPFPVDFYVQFTGSTNAGTETEDGQTGAIAAATMVADFRNTFTWAGVSELRDAHGALLDAFEVTSFSGTDYRHPIAVPEPGTALPVLAGLFALARRRR